MASIKNLYDDALVVNYKEGDLSLERSPIVFDFDLEDSSHIIQQGETLPLIASYSKYYGDSRYWWLIADANTDLIDIFTLKVGKEIIIPNIQKLT